MIFPQQGKDNSWGGDLTHDRENLSDAENQGNNGSHECMSSGGMNLGQFQGIDPRGGTEFDKNGATLVGIEGPEELHSSGIESKTGERSEMISWCRVAVEDALAKANDSNAD